MTRKELKKIARKVADLELATRNPDITDDELKDITAEMMYYQGRVKSFEELDLLDEMIQEILEKSS